jgi:hypothetical protein
MLAKTFCVSVFVPGGDDCCPTQRDACEPTWRTRRPRIAARRRPFECDAHPDRGARPSQRSILNRVLLALWTDTPTSSAKRLMNRLSNEASNLCTKMTESRGSDKLSAVGENITAAFLPTMVESPGSKKPPVLDFSGLRTELETDLGEVVAEGEELGSNILYSSDQKTGEDTRAYSSNTPIARFLCPGLGRCWPRRLGRAGQWGALASTNPRYGPCGGRRWAYSRRTPILTGGIVARLTRRGQSGQPTAGALAAANSTAPGCPAQDAVVQSR